MDMTDAHCHIPGDDPSVRELLIGRDFVGLHPWETEALTQEELEQRLASIRARLTASIPLPLGIGEIGLDRLRSREIPPRMREAFAAQLELAVEFGRPVVLHGAKCWGQVVEAVRTMTAARSSTRSTFLFHGFSRSDGLIPEIVRLSGFISVGPTVLNDHAVNYRKLVKALPLNRLLLETDRTVENAAVCPSIREVLAKTAELRGLSADELEAITDQNASAFLSPQP